RPGSAARLAAPQRVGHPLLSLGERGRLRQRPVERRKRLAAPLPRQRVTLAAQRLGHTRQLPLGIGPRGGSGRRPSVVRGLRGAWPPGRAAPALPATPAAAPPAPALPRAGAGPGLRAAAPGTPCRPSRRPGPPA